MRLLLVWVCLVALSTHSALCTELEPRVYSIDRHEGSTEGATRILIFGRGFAAKPEVGQQNNVNIPIAEAFFVNDVAKYECKVDIEGSSENIILCYTSPMPQDQYFYIQVKTAGVTLWDTNCNNSPKSNNCRFIPRWWFTPHLDKCYFNETSHSDEFGNIYGGPRDSLISCTGRMFTTKYGSGNDFDENGKDTAFRKILTNDQPCELVDGDDKYGMWLSSGDSGGFSCKFKPTLIGLYNISAILTNNYGRTSRAKGLYRVSGNEKVYMVQSYAEISSVSPAKGGSKGGLPLKVCGRSLDAHNGNIRIEVGGVNCMVVDGSFDNGCVTCITGEKPTETPEYYTGSRGVISEDWVYNYPDNVADILNYDENDENYLPRRIIDNSGFQYDVYVDGDEAKDKHSGRFTGVVVIPQDGVYRFQMKSDDAGALYVNCEGGTVNSTHRVANVPYYRPDFYLAEQKADWIEYTKGQKCYFKSVVRDGATHANMYVALLKKTTSLTGDQAARNEIQRVDFRSSHASEKQQLDFSQVPEGLTGVKEKQTVSINAGSCQTDCHFYLEFNGVKTAKLPVGITPNSLQKELRENYALNDVSVDSSYGVTFKDDGPQPLITASASSGVSVSVARTVAGKMSSTRYNLHLGTRILKNLPINDPEFAALKEALEDTKVARCPSYVLPNIQSNSVMRVIDFETKEVGKTYGQYRTNLNPFCGRTSARYLDFVYHAGNTGDAKNERHPRLNIFEYPWLCYAHYGTMHTHFYMKGTFAKSGGDFTKQTWLPLKTAPDHPWEESEDRWRYHCHNLLAIWQEFYQNELTKADLHWVKLARGAIAQEYWVDAVVIAKNPIVQNQQEEDDLIAARTPALLAAGEVINEFNAKDVDGKTEITITPANCGHNLPLAQLLGVGVNSQTNNLIKQSDAWADNAEFTSELIQPAIHPLRGSFDLTMFDEKEGNYTLKDIPVDIKPVDFEERLQNTPFFGRADVRKHDACYKTNFDIEWLSNGGDKPTMLLDASNVVGHETLTAHMVDIEDGGILYNPIPGEMLRLPYSTPQVEAYLENYPSKCTGDCSFEWDDSLTPEVTNISPLTAVIGTPKAVTITGTNLQALDGTTSTVLIGGGSCAITTVTDTQIICELTGKLSGIHKVMVTVGGKGYPKYAEGVSNDFQITGSITSVSPTSGFITGGIEVTLQGTGFSADTIFLIDETQFTSCIVDSDTQARCVVPSHSLGTVSITGSTNSIALTTSSITFEYTSTELPIITGVTPNVFAVKGGETLTISGSNFGTTEQTVLVGGKKATVVSWTATQVQCEMPRLAQGSYDVQMLFENKGLAQGSFTVTTEFKVTSFSPTVGSIIGTEVSLTGAGFVGEPDDYKITFGDAHCGDVVIESSTKINCEIGFLPKVHEIKPNIDVIRPEIAWERDYIKIHKYEAVIWKWDLKASPKTSYGIRLWWQPENGEKVAATSVKAIKGEYKRKFNEVGVYYLTTDVLDNDAWGTIYMHMVVEVVERHSDTFVLKMHAFDVDADLDMSGSISKRSTGCVGITLVPGCSPATHPGMTNAFFGDECRTPTITDISPEEGHSATEVTFTGIGFTSELCALKVTFGTEKFPCEVQSATATQIKCLPKPFETTEMYAFYSFQISVLDVGSSSLSTDKIFALKPNVNSISPVVGSTQGGTLVTLEGAGFNDQHLVTIGGSPCEIKEQTYFKIVCETSAKAAGSHTLSVAQSNTEAIDCSETNSCAFEYSEAHTPVVTAASPLAVNAANTEITLTGSNFGSVKKDVSVMIGDHECVVADDSSVSANEVKCSVAWLAGGNHAVAVSTANGKASIPTPILVEATAEATSMSPLVGSKFGGTEVTIGGHGFGESADDLSVTFGSDGAGTITAVTNEQVTCLTPASAGSADPSPVIIKLGSQTFTSTLQFTYDENLSPTFTAVTPATGSAGESVTLTGTQLDASVVVKVGDAVCVYASHTDTTSYTCTLGNNIGGTYSVTGSKPGAGAVSSSLEFEYVLEAATVQLEGGSACSGSYGGGFTLELTGKGFGNGMEVRVCDNDCDIDAVAEDGTTLSCSLEREPQVARSNQPSGIQYNKKYHSEATLSILEVQRTHKLLSNRPIGQVIVNEITDEENTEAVQTLRAITPNALKLPVSYEAVLAQVNNQDSEKVSVWRPIPPKGYVCLGDVMMVGTDVEPASDEVYCIHQGLVAESTYDETAKFETGSSTSSSKKLSLWSIQGSPFFRAVKGYDKPTDVPYRLKAVNEMTDFSTDTACDVTLTVTETQLKATASQQCNYEAAKTPSILSFSPLRGGTAGGTTITVTGEGFSTDPANKNVVSVGGVPCIVNDGGTATEITCVTEESGKTFEGDLEVVVPGKGLATLKTGNRFYFVDVWSSRFTWGGNDPPVEGDFVVVNKGQTVLLDTSTPKLRLLLINGGTFLFEDKDIELHAENILILDGGILQAGTEENPMTKNIQIVLHGHPRSLELPIYGAKSIGLREGVLRLHGRKHLHTWTRLANTAPIGATQITLQHEVDWEVGSDIVIATTGKRHSQGESEQVKITAIDGQTLTITPALKYEHVSEKFDFGVTTFETRAEVGLLTRNVVVRGSDNDEWHDKIEACPDGFDTGEFVSQTCFQGRHGEEVGSDMFGAMIMMHPPVMDTELARVELSNVELTYVGQAFKLGRYPIHFHLPGRVPNSYVRACAIHKTFNRAVTIHNTHELRVENNVVYDVMGGAIFIEDGIEQNNRITGNLAVFVKQSTSLQNDDITPAAFWVTNPDNIIENNVAAGGTHFGFWYRMHEHPDGPSFDSAVCQRHHQLGSFKNNTVHSQGWFGLWIFKRYFPKKDQQCNSVEPGVAVFEDFYVYNCEKGAEAVTVGAIQFKRFIMAHNEKAGIEYKLVGDLNVKWGQVGVYDSYIIAKRDAADTDATAVGIIMPFSEGFEVFDTDFINFSQDNSAAIGVTKIDGTCSVLCGGWEARTRGLNFQDSPNKVKFRWEHEVGIKDLDGSLIGSGSGGGVVTTFNDALDETCYKVDEFSSGPFEGAYCPNTKKFHRFAFNNPKPASLEANDVQFTNTKTGKSTSVPMMKKRLTHKFGWMVMLEDGQTYRMEFLNNEHLTNISYDGAFYNFEEGDCIVIEMPLTQKPDRVEILKPSSQPVDNVPDCTDKFKNGDYYFDANTKVLYFVVRGDPPATRKKRGFSPLSATEHAVNREIKFNVYRCYYDKCIPPPDPNTVAPARERPDDAVFYDNDGIWSLEDGWYVADKANLAVARRKKRQVIFPTENSNILVRKETWLVLRDENLPKFNEIRLEGTLELDSDESKKYKISATYILALGGRFVIGWEDNFFQGEAEIELRGTHQTPDRPINSGPNAGSKTIAGVGGGIDMHGKKPKTPWTHLVGTFAVGSDQITLKELVDWKAGDEIVVAPSSHDPWEAETFKITAVTEVGYEGSTVSQLTLNTTAKFKHSSEKFEFGDVHDPFNIDTEVGHFTRNIKVIGEEGTSQEEQFGARILIATAAGARGYGRFENVEFIRVGQKGYVDNYDPRLGITFYNTGDASDGVRPAYVRYCSFQYVYNTAIGLFGTQNVEVSNNVIYNTIGTSIRIEDSENTNLLRNLVILMRAYTASFEPPELDIILWHAAIEVQHSKKTKMIDNVVAGSERAAYRLDGEDCAPDAGEESGSGWNEGRSALHGVFMNKDGHLKCSLISKFKFHHIFDVAIYIQTSSAHVKVIDVIVSDAKNGIVPIIYGPVAANHEFGNKAFELSNAFFVGYANAGNCDIVSSSAPYISNSGLSRAVSRDGHSRTGIIWLSCNSKQNSAIGKPYYNQMSYPAINCRMDATNIQFANFGEYCGKQHQAIMTNSFSEDLMHAMYFSNVEYHNTPDDNKIFIMRPSIKKINPSDCIDMECDGMKTVLLMDNDGSLTGTGSLTSVIPQAEYGWEWDLPRGYGKSRIPITMQTGPSGERLDFTDIIPGIIRNKCTNKTAWQAWLCPDYHHFAQMVIESMDADHETRRLSPVALKVEVEENGQNERYINLLNGPQDHGWCDGYTCQERLSTFWPVVAMGRDYDLYFTGTAPKNFLLYFLNEVDSNRLLINIFISNPTRKDIYINGMYQDSMTSKPVITDPIGSNHYSRATMLLTVVLGGATTIEIMQPPMIVLSFRTPVTVDDFYKENVVQRLADFLGIDPSKIKIVDVIRESRRRRRDDSTLVTVEIGDPPQPSTSTTTSTTASPGTSVTEAPTDALTQAELDAAKSKLNSATQAKTLGDTLGGEVTDVGVLTAPTGGEHNPNNTEQEVDTTEPIEIIKIPVALKVVNDQPRSGVASQSLDVITVHGIDTTGTKVVLGDVITPWFIQATIHTGGNAEIKGHQAKVDENGDAVFTELKIMAEGNYVIRFNVYEPADASSLSALSDTIEITATPPTTTKPKPQPTNNPNETKPGEDGKSDGLSPTMIGVIAGVSIAGLLILILTAYLVMKCKKDSTKVYATDIPMNNAHVRGTYSKSNLKKSHGGEVYGNEYSMDPDAVNHPHSVMKSHPPPYEESLGKANAGYKI